LSSYPTGAHADEARFRLAGCITAPVETPGSIDERRYSNWPVPPSLAHAFPFEGQARADALKRGNDDAGETCASFGLKDTLKSASVEPKTWKCAEHDHSVMCGFTGDLVCRVQRRVLTSEERCNGIHEQHPQP